MGRVGGMCYGLTFDIGVWYNRGRLRENIALRNYLGRDLQGRGYA